MTDLLDDLEDFLCQPLVSMRSTTGPLALKEFCEGIWRGTSGTVFPAKLLVYLAAWYDLTVPRALRPAFLPEPSQSQSQSPLDIHVSAPRFSILIPS